MNDLSHIEHHVLAYWLAGQANDLNIATRWYPRTELVMIIDDKIGVAVRKFGRKARGATRAAAEAFMERMIGEGAWATQQNDFGGTMHQWQDGAYKAALRKWQDEDVVVVASRAGGDDFWETAFSGLTS